jgi:hypothetical protein
MKKYLYSLVLLLSLNVQGQRLMYKDFQVMRVSLKEKFNLPARDLPRLIIQAFCEGKITGYYPQKPQLECGYHEFAAHFNVNKMQPANKGDAYEDTQCPSAFCSNKDEETVAPFSLFFDVVEDKEFNRETSTKKHNIRYIRLVYVLEKHGMQLELSGPLFAYEDVVKLSGAEYSLFNPKNNAARISFRQYFEGRMFTGFYLTSTSQPKKQGQPNKEKDKWEH